jgi:hypothetical protein
MLKAMVSVRERKEGWQNNWIEEREEPVLRQAMEAI